MVHPPRRAGNRALPEAPAGPGRGTLGAMRLTRGLMSSLVAASVLVAGCGTAPSSPPARPEGVRARIAGLMPATVADRPGWALDIYAAFDALRIEPNLSNTCAVLAVIEQESTYRADPQVPARGMVFEFAHPKAGRTKAIGLPVKFSETPGKVTRPSPLLGQHTREVLTELGYAAAEIDRLYAEGAIA